MGRLKNDLHAINPNKCCKEWECEDGCKYYSHKDKRCIIVFLRNCETYEVYELLRKQIKPKENKDE